MLTVRSQKSLHWTAHSRAKMRYYKLSEARAKRVIHTPKRIEEGIAPNTIAMMQSAGSEKHPYEIWVMIQDIKAGRKVISVWRYPGITKPRDEITKKFLKQEYSNFTEGSDELG